MAASVQHTSFLGEKAVVAENDDLRLTLVPGWGSSVISLFSNKANAELLRVPQTTGQYQEKSLLFGIPILFPPNRIEDGTFTYEGRTYHFELTEKKFHNHIHGFVYNRPWELVRAESEDDRVVIETKFDSSRFADVLEQFPHPFVLIMKFTLEGSTLHKDATIVNPGGESFPWGIGYHTTFLFPFRSGTPLDRANFRLTAERQWELSDRLLPTGKLGDFPYREELNKGMSLEGYALDDAYASAVLNGGGNEAVLTDAEAGIEIVYKCDDNFKHWVVYNNDGKQGYLCPEPYTWITNAPNVAMPEQVTGVQAVKPGERKTVKTSIVVSVK